MSRRPFSRAEMAASTTPKGGFTAKQLRLWGVRWPPPSGWAKRLLRDGVPAACPYPAGFDPSSAPSAPVRANPLLEFGPQPTPIEMPADAIEIYTDGSCDPNPGPGGWGFAAYRGAEEVHSACAGAPATTNNRMELQAIIEALRWLKPERAAIVWTDSQYCQKGCTAWRHGWKRKGWSKGKAPLANADLWQQLDTLLEARNVDVRWTRSHVGTVGNKRADELAETGRLSVLDDLRERRSGEVPRAASRPRREKKTVKRAQVDVGPVEEDAAVVLIKRADLMEGRA